MGVRDTVLRSLSAIGGSEEAAFYANVFQSQDPERFALIVLDPRCLKNPLLEALISDLRILADLQLTPVLVVGALDDDRTSVKFQSQRLYKELDHVGIKTGKLNCASYGLIADIKSQAARGGMVVLEMTETRDGKVGLPHLVERLRPGKVIFLQPSGGLRRGGKRLPIVKIGDDGIEGAVDAMSEGQTRFVKTAGDLALHPENSATYIIASPLNLLQELFTVKGSGTLMRRAAKVFHMTDYAAMNLKQTRSSIEEAFGKNLAADFFKEPMEHAFVEQSYRGGAIVTSLAGLPYLSKFWVVQLARGEGIGRDIWDDLIKAVPAFFWRSRMNNPFNEWYMKSCHGMQISGEWRVFWRGLEAPEIPGAIIAAASAPYDFDY